jgi:copper chaperone CopZ
MRRFIVLVPALLALSLSGCANKSTAPTTSAEPTVKSSDEAGELTPAEIAQAKLVASSREPIASPTATLYVHGLSCPLCASNIDSVLGRVKGVDHIHVDLEKGVVHVGFKNIHPSQADLWTAIDNAGFTLVRVDAQ